ncbi:MAG: DUF5658 family protein [Armatimonadota bacterium]|nr:DUF5658 family protein [Armatimonadota bacterium]
MQTCFRLPLLPANIVLLFVGLLDLLTTLIWLHTGKAVEINPIMAYVLRSGIDVFVAVKMSTLLAYVAVLEWYRRFKSPDLAALIGRLTLGSYVGIYAISFAVVNAQVLLQ